MRLKASGWLHQGKERSCSAPPPEISSVEELQLALIECATEYEIKVRSKLGLPPVNRI
jgi:hypothetical protein